MKRILFFVHYNKYNNLAEYVIYLLQYIKHLYSRIVFISNSLLDEQQKLKLAGICSSIIVRENKGFDFGAWKDALLQEGWDNLAVYDNITLMNDSCFGPLCDMETVYNRMEQQDIDFWGITDYMAENAGMPGTNGPLPYHIQSYFMCFNNKIIRAETFRNFWEKVKYEKKLNKVIQKYETQLTSILKKGNYKSTVLFKSSDEINNISFCYPDIGIINSSPLVKIKSFLYFSYPKYLLQLIQNKTSYPVSLIIDYFSDVYDPSILFTITDRTLLAESSPNNDALIFLPKIAIHLHVFYMDVFEKYAAVFDNWTIKYHLFITTDTPEKKQIIVDYLQNHPSYENLEEIFVLKNYGRDVLPWLSIADKLNAYDIVGHFHTKKTLSSNSYIGLSWQQNLFDLLLVPINTIIDVFNTNKKVGIVIPDIPHFFQLNPIIASKEKKLKKSMKKLWKTMNCKKELDFRDISAFIFSYGTMFWYRPSALRPLFELRTEDIDIPEEPLPMTCILHGIERLLVYIAWSEGYDCRISKHTVPQLSAFHNNMVVNKYIEKIKNSKDYKVGKFILMIPRFIKRILLG